MQPFDRITEGDKVNSPKFRVGLNRVFDILEGLCGDVTRTGNRWRIGRPFAAPDKLATGSGGASGYEEVEGTLYLEDRAITGTFLVKSGYVETPYTSTQDKLLLSIVSVTDAGGTTYHLVPGKGYLKS